MPRGWTWDLLGDLAMQWDFLGAECEVGDLQDPAEWTDASCAHPTGPAFHGLLRPLQSAWALRQGGGAHTPKRNHSCPRASSRTAAGLRQELSVASRAADGAHTRCSQLPWLPHAREDCMPVCNLHTCVHICFRRAAVCTAAHPSLQYPWFLSAGWRAETEGRQAHSW